MSMAGGEATLDIFTTRKMDALCDIEDNYVTNLFWFVASMTNFTILYLGFAKRKSELEDELLKFNKIRCSSTTIVDGGGALVISKICFEGIIPWLTGADEIEAAFAAARRWDTTGRPSWLLFRHENRKGSAGKSGRVGEDGDGERRGLDKDGERRKRDTERGK